ncbi:MAG: HAD family phosphatase [Clostridia bacterium]|nr:HAD family phosphatase [Clostridia bacterium]
MGRFDGILLCSDLDGTLLNRSYAVSDENIEAIRYFQREGGLFTFVTGRMPYFAAHVYQRVEPNAPFGCINGGGIYDHRTGRYIWRRELPEEALTLAKETSKAFPEVGLQVNTFDRIYFCKESPVMEGFRKATGVPNCPRPLEEIDEPMAKIVFGEHDPAVMTRLQIFLTEHPAAKEFDFIHSEQMLYEMLPKGVNKGILIQKMAELLGIDPRRTVAVGDYYNDIPMLREAALGVAVANACPAARAEADAVTVSNEEHAIAAVIRDLESGKLSLY